MFQRDNRRSMVCPSCGRLISVNAPACIHCGRKIPGLFGLAGPGLRRWLANYTGLSMIIVAICVFLYLLGLVLDLAGILQPRGLLQFLSPSNDVLFRMGATGSFAVQLGYWWTLITAVYLHGGILHIVFNMMWLRQLGAMVEELFGLSRTFIIFTLSGVIGFAVSIWFGTALTIGASGANLGLMGALIYYGRQRGGDFGNAVYRQVGSWAIYAVIFGFLFPLVNNAAHIGGLVSGYLLGMLLGYKEKQKDKDIYLFIAVGLLLLTITSFVLVMFLGVNLNEAILRQGHRL